MPKLLTRIVAILLVPSLLLECVQTRASHSNLTFATRKAPNLTFSIQALTLAETLSTKPSLTVDAIAVAQAGARLSAISAGIGADSGLDFALEAESLKVLAGIARDGILTAANRERIGNQGPRSADESAARHDQVHVNVLYPESSPLEKRDLNEAIYSALFQPANGAVQILMERGSDVPSNLIGKPQAELESLLQARAQAGVIAILKINHLGADSQRGIFRQTSFSRDPSKAYENILYENIPPQAVQALVGPRRWAALAHKAFPGIPFIPVDTVSESILIIRELGGRWEPREVTMTVPDYRSAFRILLEQAGKNAFAYYAVRLYAPEDLRETIGSRMPVAFLSAIVVPFFGLLSGFQRLLVHHETLAQAARHLAHFFQTIPGIPAHGVLTLASLAAGVFVLSFGLPQGIPHMDRRMSLEDIEKIVRAIMESEPFDRLYQAALCNREDFVFEKFSGYDRRKFFMNFGYNDFFSPIVYATLIHKMKEIAPAGILTPLRILDIGSGSGYFPYIAAALGKTIDVIDINSHLIPILNKISHLRPDQAHGTVIHDSIFSAPTGRPYDIVTSVNTMNLRTNVDPQDQAPRLYVDPSDFDRVFYAVHMLASLWATWDWIVPGGYGVHFIAGRVSLTSRLIERWTGFRVVERGETQTGTGHRLGFTYFVLQRENDGSTRPPQPTVHALTGAA